MKTTNTTPPGADAPMLETAILGESMARETEQAKLLRSARDRLKVTNEELAGLLGVGLPTLISWLHPESAKAHRTMNKTAKLLLARILADKRKPKK